MLSWNLGGGKSECESTEKSGFNAKSVVSSVDCRLPASTKRNREFDCQRRSADFATEVLMRLCNLSHVHVWAQERDAAESRQNRYRRLIDLLFPRRIGVWGYEK